MKTLLIILIAISAIMAINRGINVILELRCRKSTWYEYLGGFVFGFIAGAVLWPGLFIYWTIKAITTKKPE